MGVVPVGGGGPRWSVKAGWVKPVSDHHHHYHQATTTTPAAHHHHHHHTTTSSSSLDDESVSWLPRWLAGWVVGGTWVESRLAEEGVGVGQQALHHTIHVPVLPHHE